MKEMFIKISLHGGSSYLQPIEALSAAIEGELDGAEIGTKWTLELIELTREEYELLPEFMGH